MHCLIRAQCNNSIVQLDCHCIKIYSNRTYNTSQIFFTSELKHYTPSQNFINQSEVMVYFLVPEHAVGHIDEVISSKSGCYLSSTQEISKISSSRVSSNLA